MSYSLLKSLDLLTPPQRARFAALGLPQGPEWPQPVVSAMLAAVPPDAAATPTAEDDLDLLLTLSLASLTTPEADASASSAGLPLHVRQHPLLRALAQEEWRHQLSETQQGAMSGLLDGIVDFVEDHENEFAVLQQEEELWTGAIRQAAQMQVASEGIIAAVYALNNYFNIGGHWRLGTEMWQLQLAAQRQQGNRLGESDALHNLGFLANGLGRKEEARDYYEQTLIIEHEVGDRQGEGVTLHNLGWLAEALGRREEAMQDFEQALALFVDMGMESDAQRERDALATLHERASMADADVLEAEEHVQDPPPAPDMPISPPSKQAERQGWRWPWQQ